MSKTLDDILRQPTELSGILRRLVKDGSIDRAIRALGPSSSPLIITGSGSSYHAAIAVSHLFQLTGRLAYAVEASELLHYGLIPERANVMLLSRSGRSVEVVRLIEKARQATAHIVSITNAPDSPLAKDVDVPVLLGAAFDHNISITMYTGVALAGGLVAARMAGQDLDVLADQLMAGIHDASNRLPSWREAIERSPWSQDTSATCFLARGPSVASCLGARLLWEEVAKSSASAQPTGGFRHGPQEFVEPGVRLGVWLDPIVLNAEDRKLVSDLRAEGALVMCIGARLGDLDADLRFEIGTMPAGWQFLVDIMPVQLASEYVARIRNHDPDKFRYCSFVVQSESGLRS